VPRALREQTECPRCGSDLEPVMMRVAAAAWRHRVAAIQALEAGRVGDALHHAREANRLYNTERRRPAG
jgi:uncharacterized protein (UPF0212 family)